MNERADDQDDSGPLLATVIGVGAGQVAEAATKAARKALRRSLRAAGFRGSVIGEAGALDEWGDMAMQIEALILAQWALAAEDVESAMHDEGLEPEDVALLGVPAGVVPS